MTTSDARFRYYPYDDRAECIADQTDRERQRVYMEHQFDGSPYNIYDHNGRINKGLPLNLRPPVNRTFPGFRGDIVPASQAPTFYGCNSCFGNLLMNPWNPLIRPS